LFNTLEVVSSMNKNQALRSPCILRQPWIEASIHLWVTA
jgi:hypothetical protein